MDVIKRWRIRKSLTGKNQRVRQLIAWSKSSPELRLALLRDLKDTMPKPNVKDLIAELRADATKEKICQ